MGQFQHRGTGRSTGKSAVGLVLAVALAVVFALPAFGCGAGAEESSPEWAMSMAQDSEPTAAEAVKVVEVLKEVVVEKEFAAEMARPEPMAMSDDAAAKSVDGFGTGMESGSNMELGPDGLTQVQAQAAARQRVIIHTASLTLVVDHIQGSIDHIAGVAVESGGWVVSSNRDFQHSGSISIRVPSQGLSQVVQRLRDLAREVESEIITSDDVTDEYVDLNSRLANEERTEAALIGILERAELVEDALNVQKELSAVQENIERLQGRIRFLQETSAFSLVTAHLTLAAAAMPVDAGGDQKISAAEPARFRAILRPPDGIDQFSATWDFGDGSDPVTVHRTAPTGQPGQRWTATVHHLYPDTKDSPYIVSVEVRGTGEPGIVEGEDSLTVTVLEVPRIEVFAGDSQTVRQGEEVKFSGSFTRPPELKNVRSQWDPGDGSAPIEETLGTGDTRAAATHAYQDFRLEPYRAALTIIADSEVGEVRESGEILVWVEEEPGFVVGGLDVGRAFKNAVRAFTAVVQVLFIALIWLLIFSPVWIIGGVAWWVWRRRVRRIRAERTPTEPAAEAADGGSG